MVVISSLASYLSIGLGRRSGATFFEELKCDFNVTNLNEEKMSTIIQYCNEVYYVNSG